MPTILVQRGDKNNSVLQKHGEKNKAPLVKRGFKNNCHCDCRTPGIINSQPVITPNPIQF